MPGFIICLLLIAVGALNRPPALHTTQELAKYADCKPAKIAWWLDTVAYKVQPDYESAEVIMARRTADCKGYAVVSKAALEVCGYEAHTLIIRNRARPTSHIITLYTNPHNGRRGYINGGGQMEFEAGTDWAEIVQAVPGGPWEEI